MKMNKEDKKRYEEIRVALQDLAVEEESLRKRRKELNKEFQAIKKRNEPPPGDPRKAQKVGFGI